MKKPLLKFFIAHLILFCCLFCSNKALAQTAAFAAQTGGVSTATIASGTSQVCMMGFSTTVTGGSITFTSYYFTTKNGNADDFMTNGTLYRSPTSTFNPSNPGVPVGNVAFSGTNVTISNLSETTSGTNYYFLVADAINTVLSNNMQLVVTSGNNWATDINGVDYKPKFGGVYSHKFSVATPYPLSISVQNTGLADPATIITTGTSGLKLFEFSVTNKSSSAYTLSKFNINSNTASLGSTLNNFKLYGNSSNAFPATGAIAALTSTSSSYVTFNLSNQTIAAGATQYYWLVADAYSGASPGSIQFNFTDGQSGLTSPTNPAITSSAPSGTFNTPTAYGNTYTVNYTNLNVTSLTGGTTSGTITALQNSVVLFGFSVTSSSTISVSNFNINSTVSAGTKTAQDYFDTGILYRCNNSNYASATTKVAVGTVTFNGSYANVAFNTPESITNSSANQNYFLVANNKDAAASTTITFNFANSQSTPAIVQTSPASNYNSFSIAGNTLTLPTPTLIYSVNTTGYTPQSTMVVGQTAVICAFSAKAVGDISINNPYLDVVFNPDQDPAGLFSSVTVWRSSTGTYADAQQITASSGDGASGLKITMGSSLTISSGTTYTYYVVGTVKLNTKMPATISVGSNGILGNAPNTYPSALATTPITFTSASVTITGNNTATAGITQGALSFGQTNVVLFSFKMVAQGAFTMSKMSIGANANVSGYLSNGKIYRSTTPYFADAQQITGTTTVAFAATAANIVNFNQTFTTTPTTYYYFLVGDLTTANATAISFQYNFTNGQTPAAINDGSGAGDKLNTFTTTDGTTFTIATIYKWLGTSSNDFNDPNNYKTIKDQKVTSIGSNILIEIGAVAYTTPPNISGDITVGGVTFGTAVSNPTLTIAQGKNLTINGSLTTINGMNATISGSSSTITINSTANSALSGASTLNLSGVTVNNAGTFAVSGNSVLNLASSTALTNTGTFTLASTAALNLTGNSTANNTTGTFTLASDAKGSATIGPMSGTSAMTGSYNVQRYIQGQGDLNYRGYRLLSSQVSDATQTAYYSLAYLKGSGSYLSGSNGSTNGFDVSGNATLYLYRQDKAPSTSPTAGNFIGITNIKNSDLFQVNTTDNPTTPISLPVGNGIFYFFRGNNGTNTTTLPNDVTLSASGHLNQGQVTVKPWFYSLAPSSFASADNLSYTPDITGATGYTLVGNPYASSIDWTTAFGNSTSTSGIYAPNVDATIYVYNAYQKKYATFQSTGTNGAGIAANGGSNIIPSGQGFFVHTSSPSAKIIFNESAKITNQLTGSNLLLNSASTTQSTRILRVKLVRDTIEQEETILAFNNNAKNAYVEGEDATYLRGYGVVSFASQSADKKLLAINKLPLPKTSQSIPVDVIVTQTGSYHINFSQQNNIPDAYDVWLKDAYLKDSLDIKHNGTYNFKVSSDTSSTGANRFSIVMRLNPNKVVHLLDFAANKETSQVKINWTAENEADYTKYTLERSTDAGKTFKVLDSLTSANLGHYIDLDPSPILGNNYYRLKQTDVGGNVSYSNVVKVMYANVANTILANSNISVYPNPAKSTLNLAITSTDGAEALAAASYKITITNSLGLPVKTDVSAGTNWQGQIDNLLPGTYFIQVINTKNGTLAGKSTFIKL